jgi:hypothetical protein
VRAVLKDGPVLLFDDLNDAARSRFDQNRATIHHCVSIFAYTVLRRHIVIGNTFFRENRPNSQIFAILIRRASLFDDIRTEARTLIDPEDAGDTANDAPDHATNNRPDRTSRPFTIATLNATRNAWALATGRNTATIMAAAPTKRRFMITPWMRSR